MQLITFALKVQKGEAILNQEGLFIFAALKFISLYAFPLRPINYQL